MDTTNIPRRAFMRSSRAFIGAALAPAVLAGMPSARAQTGPLPRLWNGGEVLIGQSPAEQAPSPSISCPLYFPSGQYAHASHALDLAALPVRGDITWHGDTVVPDLGASLAVNLAAGTDGFHYLLVAAEGSVSGGRGYLSGVTRAIVRCKYKAVIGAQGPLLLACHHCVVVLVRH